MSMKLGIVSLLAAAGCGFGLLACSAGSSNATNGAPAALGPENRDQWDYRRVRFADAFRGLRVADGLIVLDPQAAPDLQVGLTPAASAPAVERGHALMLENDYTGATAEFRLAILADQDNPDAYEGLGDALLGRKRDADALAAYRTAAMLDPANADLRLKFAETINRTGDLDGWAAELERILAFSPNHGEAHARLAVARHYQGDHESARAHVTLAERFGGNVPPQLKAMLGH
ncbi:MAG: hypothetical protein KIS87_10185 [Phycisphaeraceae bacterium]|nr:hypothetical protein [Phycisphaeraceae bacterium]